MKKRGSALVVVLFTLTALLVVGLAVYSYIVSTSKVNNAEKEKESLETAAMSALNIGEYYLINKEKYKNIASGDSININKSDIENLLNDNNFKNIKYIKEDYRLSSILYNYSITLKNNGDGNYNVESKVSNNNSEITKDSIVKIKINNGISIFNALDNNMIGMFNILNDCDFSIYDSDTKIKNASYNFYNMKDLNSLPSELENADNLNPNNKKINKLKLKLKKGDINIYMKTINNFDGESILRCNEYNIPTDENILKNYSAVLVSLSDNKYMLICNGNVNIEGIMSAGYNDNFFIYADGTVSLDNCFIGYKENGWGGILDWISSWANSSIIKVLESIFGKHYTYYPNNITIVSGDGISISNSYLNIKGTFSDSNEQIKNILKKLIK